MNNRQKRTLQSIFSSPTPGNIRWVDIESLIEAVEAVVVVRRH